MPLWVESLNPGVDCNSKLKRELETVLDFKDVLIGMLGHIFLNDNFWHDTVIFYYLEVADKIYIYI